MDYKRVLVLHYTNGMSGREIAEATGDGKTTVNEFLKTIPGMRGTFISTVRGSHKRIHRGKTVPQGRKACRC